MNLKEFKIFLIVFILAFQIKAQTGEIYGRIISSDGDSIGAAFVSSRNCAVTWFPARSIMC